MEVRLNSSSPVKETKRPGDSLKLHCELLKEPEWQRPGRQCLVQILTHKISSPQCFFVSITYHLGGGGHSIFEVIRRHNTVVKPFSIMKMLHQLNKTVTPSAHLTALVLLRLLTRHASLSRSREHEVCLLPICILLWNTGATSQAQS